MLRSPWGEPAHGGHSRRPAVCHYYTTTKSFCQQYFATNSIDGKIIRKYNKTEERGETVSVSDNLKRGTIELMLLTLLNESDMYGYQLCQTLEERSEGLFIVKEGSLYPTLYRLLGKGLISDRKEKVGVRRTRVYYHLEPAGEVYLQEIRREYDALSQGILHVLQYTRKEG